VSFQLSNIIVDSYPNVLWRLLRRGSPLPIPNREVKPACADGTWPKARESMSMPILKRKSLRAIWGFFVFRKFQIEYRVIIYVEGAISSRLNIEVKPLTAAGQMVLGLIPPVVGPILKKVSEQSCR
jgi:hypothetical protein